MTEIFRDFFSKEEHVSLTDAVATEKWELLGWSTIANTLPIFWYKNIFDTSAKLLFIDKLQNKLNCNIIVDRLYVNGQAHGQCGFWHTDVVPERKNCYTLVYFPNEWLPEYGGHLLIKSNPLISVIPEFNKAVIFDSTLEHMGMEPTVHCKTQRESIACKFRIINE